MKNPKNVVVICAILAEIHTNTRKANEDEGQGINEGDRGEKIAVAT